MGRRSDNLRAKLTGKRRALWWEKRLETSMARRSDNLRAKLTGKRRVLLTDSKMGREKVIQKELEISSTLETSLLEL